MWEWFRFGEGGLVGKCAHIVPVPSTRSARVVNKNSLNNRGVGISLTRKRGKKVPPGGGVEGSCVGGIGDDALLEAGPRRSNLAQQGGASNRSHDVCVLCSWEAVNWSGRAAAWGRVCRFWDMFDCLV